MSTTSLSVEAFTTDLNYFSVQMQYASEGLKNVEALALEDEGESGKGVATAVKSKITSFFKWMGELIARLREWISGQGSSDVQVEKSLTAAVKAGVGKEETTVEQVQAATEKTPKEAVNVKQELDKYFASKAKAVEMLNTRGARLLVTRVMINRDSKSMEFLASMQKELLEDLATGSLEVIARATSRGDLERTIGEFFVKYERLKELFGGARLSEGVRVKIEQIEAKNKIEFTNANFGDALYGLQSAQQRMPDSKTIDHLTKVMQESSKRLEKNIEKAVEDTTSNEFPQLTAKFMAAYHDTMAAIMPVLMLVRGHLPVASAIRSSVLTHWATIQDQYRKLNHSSDDGDKQAAAIIKSMIPSIS